jgi:hypothetical protein
MGVRNLGGYSKTRAQQITPLWWGPGTPSEYRTPIVASKRLQRGVSDGSSSFVIKHKDHPAISIAPLRHVDGEGIGKLTVRGDSHHIPDA